MASFKEILIISALLFLPLLPGRGLRKGSLLSARNITDMAGRKVTIPDQIIRIIPYDNKTNVLLFPIAGNQMIAKARSMESPILRYISKDFLKLREVDTKNAEEIMKLHPDILVVAAFISNRDDITRYEAFAQKINVPLVVVDLELMKLDKSYQLLGELLGKGNQAAVLSTYIKNIYKDAARLKSGKHVPGKAYVANDNDGLRSVPGGSNHAQVFEEMNIPNCVKAPLDSKGFATVSMEQIMVWNPDYVFCIGKGETSPYRTIMKSAVWKHITAVKTKRVFFVPTEPYMWFDMPPSINRLLGLIWFGDIFYSQPNEITKDKVQTFYQLFYKYNLTDKEYNGLFRWQ